MSDTDVGGIVAYLRLDPSDWKREAAEADAAVEKLEGRDPHVKITVDGAAAAIAQVQAVTRAESALQDANERVRRAEVNLADVRRTNDASSEKVLRAEYDLTKARRDAAFAETSLASASQRADAQLNRLTDTQDRSSASTRKQEQGFNALVPAIVAVAPAMVPIAAGAAGLAAALGAMGAVGLVAVKGVQEQMAEATPVGRAFSAGIDTLSADFDRLGQTAAPRVLAAFQQGVTLLNGSMPQLNSLTGDLATVTGKVGVNLLTGLVDGMLQLTPLIEDGAVSVLHLTNEFSSLMSGGGVTEFGDYARSVLPQVVATVEDLATTAGHLVVALAPLGGGALTAVQGLSQAINAIPLPVLTTLATVAPAAFIGFKSAGLFKDGVTALADGLEGLGPAAARAATGVRTLEAAAGPIGLALAAASVAMTFFSDQSRQAEQSANDYADALTRTNGVIDDSIRHMIAKNLADAGALEDARKLGISLSQVTDYVLGQGDAVEKVNAVLAENSRATGAVTSGYGAVSSASDTTRDAALNLNKVLTGQNAQFNDGVQKSKDMAAATAETAGATTQAATAQAVYVGRILTTTDAIGAAVTAAQAHAAATASATLEMVYENNAAGLLKQSLDALNGKVLNVEEAQTRTAQATLNATKTIKDNKSALDLNTAAGAANRAAIEQGAEAAQNQAQAIATQTGSQDQANASILRARDNLMSQLGAQHLLTPAIQDYVTKLYTVPTLVKTTVELHAEKAASTLGTLKAMLDSLHDKTINVVTAVQTKNVVGHSLSAGAQAAVNANGSIVGGGGVRAMASGDVLGGGRGAMVSSRPILWGEAGPEAYIPLSPGPRRPRAEKLLAATNDAMGDPLGAGKGFTNNITINGDARSNHEIAVDVVRQIVFATA